MTILNASTTDNPSFFICAKSSLRSKITFKIPICGIKKVQLRFTNSFCSTLVLKKNITIIVILTIVMFSNFKFNCFAIPRPVSRNCR